MSASSGSPLYQSYFGLADAPFSIAPDPRYLYMSARHQEALAHLLYGLGGGGFVLLTGEVGTGKTTVCRCLLEQIPESCDLAYIFNPRLTVPELLSSLCSEFGIAHPPGTTSIKVFVDCINEYLLAAHARGRHTVLIIDEAQNLSAEVLEQMRLLTNLETNERKLLQIILIGQPELGAMLSRPELRQLAQRIVARYHLGPLAKSDVAAYVRHRLEVSGAKHQLVPASVMGRLYALSGGVPRVLNVLCDRALLGAYVEGKERIDRATLDKAAREVLGPRAVPNRRALPALIAGLVLVAGGAIAMTFYQDHPKSGAPAVQQAPPPSAAALPETLEWTADEPMAHSSAIAYGVLFRAWGRGAPGANPCREAEALGLRCRSARGGLDELRRLNRPAVLQMRDAAGETFFAALTGLDARSATFSFGARSQRVAIGALASQWTGGYTLLWRAPQEVAHMIQPGERGVPVAWLSRQLARVQGTPDKEARDVFDEALVRQVKQFQLAQGLIPDGTVGTQTLMHVASAADPSAPSLASKVK